MNKLRATSLIILLTICLMGCGDFEAIYNDDNLIATSGDSHSTGINSWENINGDVRHAMAQFSGIKTVWEYYVEEDTDITLTYAASLEGGAFKVVMVSPDDEVLLVSELIHVDGNAETEKVGTFTATKGTWELKIVGLDARISYFMNISHGKLSND